jgi:hypothetical protein
MWVPADMREHYANVSGIRFDGVARYERFRRFTVSTEEQVVLPEP